MVIAIGWRPRETAKISGYGVSDPVLAVRGVR
jgi:hypothetical protein